MQKSYHLIATILACAFATTPLQAQFKGAPDSLSHQGLLTDGGGVPVPDASYSIVFTLYDAAAAGSSVWTETQSVTTSNGVFDVWLGSVNSLAEVPFDKQLWLGTKVGADPEMAPRSPLTSAPYALSLRNLRVEPGVSNCVGYCGPNLIGGYEGNAVSGGAVGATVFGGGEFLFSAAPKVDAGMRSEVVSGMANEVTGNYGVVSGGIGNSAGSRASVSGGENNEASGGTSHVGGGVGNVASGAWATIPGGLHNNATGDVSFAAGYRAKAVNDHTFVWADEIAADFTSTAKNQFLIRASGGVGIGTASPASDLHVKQSVSAIARGIRIENSGNTNYWRVYTDNVNDYNFLFNGVIIGWIDDATGEYVDNVGPSALAKTETTRRVLDDVTALHPVQASYEADGVMRTRPVLDVVEVERLFPEVVVEKDGQKAVAYQRLGVVAIQAIQELEARVAELEGLVRTLASEKE